MFIYLHLYKDTFLNVMQVNNDKKQKNNFTLFYFVYFIHAYIKMI